MSALPPERCVLIVVLVEDGTGAPTKAEHEAAVHNIRTYVGRALDAATIEEYWTAIPPS